MWGGMTARPREENTITTRPAPAALAPRRLAPAPLPGVRHRGQLRMAERFLAEHGNGLRHVHGIGWHVWDGTRWREDEERADLDAAVETVKTALRAVAELPPDEREELLKDIRRSESASGLEGMAKIASARYPVSTASKKLDADPDLFNTPGGTIDLHAEALREHDRGDHITKVAGGSVTGQQNTEWVRFIERILPDEEVRRFVQRLVGLAMLGAVREHVMPIFTGTGANGKGTFRDAVMAAFGDYAYEADPQLLMESRHERHGTFKMQLRGRRIVFCSETERDRKFAEASMKRLVGGDPIEANYMHKNPITFMPSHTLIMMTNHLPKVSGDDPAVWRRILVVPFDVVIPEDERDPDLPRRLREATDAVLSWAYEGWQLYRDEGLNPPEVVRRRTSEYQSRSDVMARFFDDRVLETPHGQIKARDLYAAWVAWCHSTGEQATSEVAFSAAMENRGFEKKRTSAGQQYKGLMLQSTDDEDEDEPDGGWRDARAAAVAHLLTPRQPQIPAT
jgi:putative DNA primase/helicase